MKLHELNTILGDQITKVIETKEMSKDDLHKVDSITKLSKQIIGIANVTWRADKLKHETKSNNLEVLQMI